MIIIIFLIYLNIKEIVHEIINMCNLSMQSIIQVKKYTLSMIIEKIYMNLLGKH